MTWGRRDGRFLALAVGVLVVMGGLRPVAAAGQLDARREPERSGPLFRLDSACGSQAHKHRTRIVARSEYCIWVYGFDALRETDVTRDYAVAWLQTTVDAARGWCATRVETRIKASRNVEITRVAPSRPIRVPRRKRVDVTLRATAGGSALEKGTVTQALIAYPRRTRIEAANDGRTRRTAWRGRTTRKLAFVLGVEAAAETLDLTTRDFRGGPSLLRLVRDRSC